jgi:heat shock protein HtpX
MLPVNGLYGHIQRNNMKSLVLFAGFVVLLEVLEFACFLFAAGANVQKSNFADQGKSVADVLEKLAAPGGFFDTGWIYPIAIGIAWLVIGCAWNAYVIRYETKARRVSRADQPELYNIVENLAITAGLPMPRVEMIESPVMNAYASGFTPKGGVIAVTRGLMHRLQPAEIEAVIAHELTHIRYRDVRLMVVAKTCMSLVAPLGQMVQNCFINRPAIAVAVAVWLALMMTPVLAAVAAAAVLCVSSMSFALRGLIAQSREFVADAGAIELTKDPDALIAALLKISRDDRLPDLSATTQAMMFSSDWESSIASHPPVAERIAAIKRHAATARQNWPAKARPARTVPPLPSARVSRPTARMPEAAIDGAGFATDRADAGSRDRAAPGIRPQATGPTGGSFPRLRRSRVEARSLPDEVGIATDLGYLARAGRPGAGLRCGGRPAAALDRVLDHVRAGRRTGQEGRFACPHRCVADVLFAARHTLAAAGDRIPDLLVESVQVTAVGTRFSPNPPAGSDRSSGRTRR